MATQDFKRKLTAILSADVKGYSRLMGEDEEATVRTITAYREVITKVVKKHRGRVVDSPGDNILSEFASVVDAVRSSVEIQEKLKVKNAELPENRRMDFRIGINLGDVIHEKERIYGDGVNVAARVESLADAGGICVSRSAYDQVKDKLTLGYKYLGEHSVKNIAEPVRVYRVLTKPEDAGKVIGEKKGPPKQRWKLALAAVVFAIVGAIAVMLWNAYFRPPPVEVASVEKMAFPLPDKPSIAVLPFVNMSGDPEQEYFSDGITEEIITGLSKVPRLFVIARNSTFTYKGKPVKVQQVSEDLGVRYILEGSVRKAGDKVRITVQLIDAITGHHLWVERYDRDLKDIFTLQDEITLKVMTALHVKLMEGDQARSVAKGTKNIEAYVKFLKGVEYIKRFTPESNVLTRQMAEDAIALDPEYPRGYRLLAAVHWLDVMYGSSKSPSESLEQAVKLYQKVIAMDPSDAVAYSFLGVVYTIQKQYENAVDVQMKAIAINPNAADAHAFLGRTLFYSGRPGEAIDRLKKAFRLNPMPPNWYFHYLGHAYFFAGLYEEAIAEYRKSLTISPDNLLAHIGLAACYSSVGSEEEARAEAAEVLRINPKFSLDYFVKKFPIKNQVDRDRFFGALRKAGLPDKPPLPLPDKPSIAVLPFENMSDDPKQEYFSDGLTEEIITALSKVRKLFVIAHNSTFTYKGKPVKVQQVSRELGVRYILKGSVRKSGEQIRITAQLIDATTGNHLWAERYDRDLKDIFAVQDEITKKIITAMQVKLTEGEEVKAAAKGTNNFDAYLKYLQAKELVARLNIESNALAKQLAEEAIALDPEYAWAYAVLARTNMVDVWLRSSKSPKQSIGNAMKLLQKAIALDVTFAEAHGRLGFLYSMTRQHEKGVAEGEKAVALNPNSAAAHFYLGKVLAFAGRWEESIPEYKKALRLNPIPPHRYLWSLGLSYCFTGQYEEAITWCEKAVRQAPDSLLDRIIMAVVYSKSGREKEARVEVAEALKISPKFTLAKFEKKLTYKKKADVEQFIGALRKAGLK